MRALICLLLLTPLLAAQTTFQDPAFSFSIALPEGLAALDDAALREALQWPEDQPLNPEPDPDDPDNLGHTFQFVDQAGRGRSLALTLGRSPKGLPFADPEQFVAAMKGEMGLVVDSRDQVEMPLPRFVLKGTVTTESGVRVKLGVAYLILGKNAFGLVRGQCLEADWSAFEGEFDAALQSLRYPPPQMGGGPARTGAGAAGPPTGGAPGAAGAPGVAAAGGAVAERWDTLEVTGSLVLAALLLMSLFVSGSRS